MDDVKAVVLARGLGRRMRENDEAASLDASQRLAAAQGHKSLMPVGAGRPFLDYVLSRLADAGVKEVCLVVAPDHAAVRAHYRRTPPRRVRLRYAVQETAGGTAHAVAAAEVFAGTDPFLVVNGDNLYPVDTLQGLVALPGPGLAAFDRPTLVRQSGFPASRVARFAVIETDADGWLVRLREKPALDDPALTAQGTLVSMNLWRFDRRIFAACGDVPLSPRGEFELTDAVALSIERGTRYRVVPAAGAVLDLSHRGDVAVVSRQLAGEEPVP